jgi:hypothetical protein
VVDVPRSFAAASQNADGSLAPRIVVFLPVDLPRSDIQYLFGKEEMQWRGYVSPLDTRNYVSQLMGHAGAETLLERAAAEVIVRLSGWDGGLARALAVRDCEDLADPLSILSEMPLIDRHPSWSNGLIDEWDGAPFNHSLACLSAGDEATLKRRLWLAQSHVITPFVGDVIDLFVDRYEGLLSPSFRIRSRPGRE